MDGTGDLTNAGEVQGDGMVAGRERTHEGFKEDNEEDAGVLVDHLKILVVFGDQVLVLVLYRCSDIVALSLDRLMTFSIREEEFLL